MINGRQLIKGAHIVQFLPLRRMPLSLTANQIVAKCQRVFGPSPRVASARELSDGTFNTTFPMADFTMFVLAMEAPEAHPGHARFWQAYGAAEQTPETTFRQTVYEGQCISARRWRGLPATTMLTPCSVGSVTCVQLSRDYNRMISDENGKQMPVRYTI